MSSRFERLGKDRHDRAGFDCGVPSLNTYLQRQASQDARRGVANTFVLSDDAGTILGYFTLSNTSVDLEGLPEDLQKGLPRYPVVPATLVGRLATSVAHRGQGGGAVLLFEALRRAYEVSTVSASWAVVVDAKDERAAGFYAHYGFLGLPGTPDRLVLPMRTVARLLE